MYAIKDLVRNVVTGQYAGMEDVQVVVDRRNGAYGETRYVAVPFNQTECVQYFEVVD